MLRDDNQHWNVTGKFKPLLKPPANFYFKATEASKPCSGRLSGINRDDHVVAKTKSSSRCKKDYRAQARRR
jgi:hypothetical protein